MAEVKITDAQLRSEREAGLTSAQIAAKYGMSRASVGERVRKLNLTTTAVAVVAPVESRAYVRSQLDAIQELLDSLTRVKLLYDACDAWLRDAENPNVYNVGPRSEEVLVTYWDASEAEEDEEGVRKAKKKKASLASLLRRIDDSGILTISSESRHADPRTLILQTAQECRQIVTTCKELTLQLADARAMMTLREALLTEIAKVSPDVAQQIADAVRRILLLHAAPGGPDGASAGPTLSV